GDFIGSQNHRYGYTHGGFWGCQIADIKFGDALHVWSRLCHPSPSASSGSNPPYYKRRKIERPTRKKSSAQGRNASVNITCTTSKLSKRSPLSGVFCAWPTPDSTLPLRSGSLI